MNLLNSILIIIIVLLFVTFIKKIIIKETFNLGNNYSIKFDNKKKSVEIYNILSKVVGDDITGLKLNGKNSYIKMPHDLNKFTLSFILYLENVNKKQTIIDNDWQLIVENANLLLTHKNEKILLDKPLNSKEFIHIAVKQQNNELTLFLDGIQTSKTFETKFKTKDNIIFGKHSNNINFVHGIIGELSLSSTLLTTDELCKQHDSCGIGSCSYITDGSSRDECFQNCMASKDKECNETSCSNKCYNRDTSNWKPQCEFKPYGTDVFNCIDMCSTKKNCNYNDCGQLCNNCKDIDNCPWKIPEEDEPEENPFKPDIILDTKGKPQPPKIKVTPFNGKLLIEWNRPKKYIEVPVSSKTPNTPVEEPNETTVSGNNETTVSGNKEESKKNEVAYKKKIVYDDSIMAYVCIMFKTTKKNDGINLSMVPYPNKKKCSYVVDKLSEDELYTVGIRAYNNKGLSKLSNLISTKPVYKTQLEEDNPTPEIVEAKPMPIVCGAQ